MHKKEADVVRILSGVRKKIITAGREMMALYTNGADVRRHLDNLQAASELFDNEILEIEYLVQQRKENIE